MRYCNRRYPEWIPLGNHFGSYCRMFIMIIFTLWQVIYISFMLGCGKTEIARRIAKLSQAPFIKVEATKFTEVGFHGKDVDQIIKDLVDISINMTKQRIKEVRVFFISFYFISFYFISFNFISSYFISCNQIEWLLNPLSHYLIFYHHLKSAGFIFFTFIILIFIWCHNNFYFFHEISQKKRKLQH